MDLKELQEIYDETAMIFDIADQKFHEYKKVNPEKARKFVRISRKALMANIDIAQKIFDKCLK